jgi:hypothetical protein
LMKSHLSDTHKRWVDRCLKAEMAQFQAIVSNRT